jgi:MoxR-like ATPase
VTDPDLPAFRIPDSRDGRAYIIDPEVAFAVDVAVATGRPLLLRGEPGSGKSSLAAFVARQRGWRYYEHVVTSRTTARDLLWSFDAVRRLADAQVKRPDQRFEIVDYVEPGVLWWAFAPEQARRRGAAPGEPVAEAYDPNPGNAGRSASHAVVLIDEIDKADPDMPNGMLVPLGSSEFEVTDTHTRVRRSTDAAQHLTVITTNEERELPQALLRRCVVAWVPPPSVAHLVNVAEQHTVQAGAPFTAADLSLAEALAHELMEARDEAERAALRKPSTAEYLDALQALRTLGVTVGSDRWRQLRMLTLAKVQQPSGRATA